MTSAMTAPRTALIVLPTYNERENIEKMVYTVLRLGEAYQVLIVDDASPDGTGTLADELATRIDRVRVLHRPAKLGLGSAYLEAFRFALKAIPSAEAIFEMDADGSHDPGMLPRLLQELDLADVVIGSRYQDGIGVVNWSWFRLMLSYYANRYCRMLLGRQIYDWTGGFIGYRRSVLETLNLNTIRSEGYAYQIEMKFRCLEQGFTLCEIPIIFTDRLRGRSKMSRRIVWEAIWVVWRLRLGAWRSRR